MRTLFTFTLAAIAFGYSVNSQADELIVIDSHIHYSHDAWQKFPPPKAVEILRDSGLKKAFVSSSSDQGTQMLYQEAPDLIVPVLRPYRKRGETYSWLFDESVPGMLSELLDKNVYAGIGEFHVFGDQVELPVFQSVLTLAEKHQMFLHAHSDADAVQRIFKHYPEAIVLWAHSGFDQPDEIRAMLEAYPNLWSDLAYRSEHAYGDKVDAEWLALFSDYPERFMLGTDTFAPERWYYVKEHADWSRQWLASLPSELAENIAYRNAEDLLKAVDKSFD